MRLSWGNDWPLAIVLAAAAMMAVPLWLVDSPAMPDYPAHLASFYLIGGAAHDHALAGYYHIEWAAIPNLAFELAVPFLGRVMSLAAAIKLLLSLSVAMWVTAPALINRALYGRSNVASFGAIFFAYNDNFMWGFFNYYLSAGLALAAFALWLTGEKWYPLVKVLVFASLTLLIYFCHVFGAALLLLMLGMYEAARFADQKSYRLRPAVERLWPLASIALPSAIAFLFLKPGGTDNHVTFKLFDTMLDRYQAAIALNFDQPGYVALAALIAFLVIAIWRRWISFHRYLVPMVVAVLVLALTMPEEAMGGWGVDLRLPAVFGLLLFASAQLKLPKYGQIGLAAMVLIAVAWNAAALAGNWRYYDEEYSEFRAAAKELPRGVRLMTVLDGDAIGEASDQPYWHIAEFEVIDRSAFTPLLFTTKGQHVVQLNPGLEHSAAASAQQGSPPDVTELDDLAAGTTDGDWDIAHVFPYLLNFPCKYDEVALIHLHGKRSPVPDMLHLRHAGSFFSLYDIDKESCLAR